MPSPFPGMDPYLEGSLWTSLHFTLGAEIVRQLAPQLRPKYVASPVERFVMNVSDISVTTSNIYPDVAVLQTAPPTTGPAQTTTIAAPLRLATVMPELIPHVTIEIHDTENRQLVTIIEIISPTNKGKPGRVDYLKKRDRILLSSVHLLEIDLLRKGQRVPMQHPLPKAAYFVFLSRTEDRPMTEVWPIQVDDPLPTVPLPLLATDPDVRLDLQAAFTAAYDLLGFDLRLDYQQPPEIPLD